MNSNSALNILWPTEHLTAQNPSVFSDLIYIVDTVERTMCHTTRIPPALCLAYVTQSNIFREFCYITPDTSDLFACLVNRSVTYHYRNSYNINVCRWTLIFPYIVNVNNMLARRMMQLRH